MRILPFVVDSTIFVGSVFYICALHTTFQMDLQWGIILQVIQRVCVILFRKTLMNMFYLLPTI